MREKLDVAKKFLHHASMLRCFCQDISFGRILHFFTAASLTLAQTLTNRPFVRPAAILFTLLHKENIRWVFYWCFISLGPGRGLLLTVKATFPSSSWIRVRAEAGLGLLTQSGPALTLERGLRTASEPGVFSKTRKLAVIRDEAEARHETRERASLSPSQWLTRHDLI